MLINARLIGVLVGAALVGGCACMPHGGENKLPTISCAAGASCAPVELAIQCQGGDCRIQDVGDILVAGSTEMHHRGTTLAWHVPRALKRLTFAPRNGIAFKDPRFDCKSINDKEYQCVDKAPPSSPDTRGYKYTINLLWQSTDGEVKIPALDPFVFNK